MKPSKPIIREILQGVVIRKDSAQDKNHVMLSNETWKDEISSALFSAKTSVEDTLILTPRIRFSVAPYKYTHIFSDDQLRAALNLLLSEDFNELIHGPIYTKNKKILKDIDNLIRTLTPLNGEDVLQKDYINRLLSDYVNKTLTLSISYIEKLHYTYNICVRIRIFGKWRDRYVVLPLSDFSINEFESLSKQLILELVQQ